jgi:hypothetical protein
VMMKGATAGADPPRIDASPRVTPLPATSARVAIEWAVVPRRQLGCSWGPWMRDLRQVLVEQRGIRSDYPSPSLSRPALSLYCSNQD